MITNGPATIYNRSIDLATRSEIYHRALIPAVQWVNRKAAHVLATGGLQSADQATIHIPLASGKYYKEWPEWNALTNKGLYWTLHPGDYIVQGNVPEKIGVGVEEISVTALRTKYDIRALSITTIDPWVTLGSMSMRHWKVGAA